ncbi:MAG TPA: hypothetical protein VHQ01_06805 [Pyrinomonadaceae bacterium]|nr:hypothetical protein [Pyrinomonadaceae bacterium]
MKNIKYLSIVAAGILCLVLTGCQKTDSNSNAGNGSNANAAANVNAKSETAAKTDTGATGTPTDAYKTAYTARKNKDIEGLKKVLSKDILDFFTMLGSADEKKKKSLDDMLKELCEHPQAATAEARNEKITGDKATIEYLDETGAWRPMDFVKEDGAWKLTIDKADKDSPDDKDKNSPDDKDKK